MTTTIGSGCFCIRSLNKIWHLYPPCPDMETAINKQLFAAATALVVPAWVADVMTFRKVDDFEVVMQDEKARVTHRGREGRRAKGCVC
jgi:hypothetical protein